MKRINLLLILSILLSGYVSMAQEKAFELKQSNPTGIYKKGEKIRVYAFVASSATDSLKVTVRRNNDQVVAKKAFLPTADSILIYEGSSSKPCSFIVEARL
ncbi:MAG TPA: hypothetical protein VFG54_15860, partial [Prolixibacteraceae bacterium]|nr:hypothetical protein [Prolixibacteraceae bacterium]